LSVLSIRPKEQEVEDVNGKATLPKPKDKLSKEGLPMVKATDEQQHDEWLVYDRHCKGEFEVIRETQRETQVVLLKKIDDLQKTLLGNGKEGLITIQARQSEKIDSNTGKLKALLGIMSAVFIFVAGRMVWELITHIQNTP